MKKIEKLMSLAVIAAAFALVSCGDTSESATEGGAEAPAEKAEAPAEKAVEEAKEAPAKAGEAEKEKAKEAAKPAPAGE